MNRPNLTLLSRIALVIASLAIIFAHESVRGVITMVFAVMGVRRQRAKRTG